MSYLLGQAYACLDRTDGPGGTRPNQTCSNTVRVEDLKNALGSGMVFRPAGSKAEYEV